MISAVKGWKQNPVSTRPSRSLHRSLIHPSRFGWQPRPKWWIRRLVRTTQKRMFGNVPRQTRRMYWALEKVPWTGFLCLHFIVQGQSRQGLSFVQSVFTRSKLVCCWLAKKMFCLARWTPQKARPWDFTFTTKRSSTKSSQPFFQRNKNTTPLWWSYMWRPVWDAAWATPRHKNHTKSINLSTADPQRWFKVEHLEAVLYTSFQVYLYMHSRTSFAVTFYTSTRISTHCRTSLGFDAEKDQQSSIFQVAKYGNNQSERSQILGTRRTRIRFRSCLLWNAIVCKERCWKYIRFSIGASK